jgi:hypothetical protein
LAKCQSQGVATVLLGEDVTAAVADESDFHDSVNNIPEVELPARLFNNILSTEVKLYEAM